ncbi:Dienelactone hydrolase family protein [Streptomyces sp. YIM 130001]|nr:Dienelactone hydrolase family protein [Streptomyces sp. YIM 130001]
MTGALADNSGEPHIHRARQPLGAVVLLHSWFGLTHHFRGLCDRLAEVSLSTVAPDLYGGPQTDDLARG